MNQGHGFDRQYILAMPTRSHGGMTVAPVGDASGETSPGRSAAPLLVSNTGLVSGYKEGPPSSSLTLPTRRSTRIVRSSPLSTAGNSASQLIQPVSGQHRMTVQEPPVP